MELQDTRFMRFVTHFWIDYQRFKGLSRTCAVILNFFILLLKLILCGAILLILAPHLGASALRNRSHLNALQKIAYGLLVVVCLVIDAPLVIFCIAGVTLTIMFLLQGQLLESIILAIMSWAALCLARLLLRAVFSRTATEDEDEEIEDEVEEEVEWTDADDDVEELPFCQLFTLGKDMCLLVDHIEMCPDETAFIRVAGEDSYTPLYRRKVRRDKSRNRFIVFNGANYYLDDKKTQPIIKDKQKDHSTV